MNSIFRNVAVSLMAALSFSTMAADSSYPSKPIRLIVPWAAGGASDVAARALTRVMADEGYQVIIENVAGATGQIGLAKVASAAPDGYTLGYGTTSTLALAAQNMTKLKVEQFTSIAISSVDPLLLLVPATGPATLEAFLDVMKKNPGKISIGTPGNNNVNHMFAILTARAAGTDFVSVPYPGGAKVISDLAGKQIDAGVLKPAESKSQIDAGLVKPLAVFANERLPFMPNVPTFKEKGFNAFPYGPISQMSYLVAPAGLPVPIRDKLTAAVRKAIQSKPYKAFATDNGFVAPDVHGRDLDSALNQMQSSFYVVGAKVFK